MGGLGTFFFSQSRNSDCTESTHCKVVKQRREVIEFIFPIDLSGQDKKFLNRSDSMPAILQSLK